MILRRDTGLRKIADAAALGDADLRLHDVETGNNLGDRVFDLNARVDLDEVERAGIDVHQELNGAGAAIIGGASDFERGGAKGLASHLVEVGRRRTLDDLLVTALDRAVALEQMHDRAVLVAENLHLHMARAAHQLLQINFVLAKSRTGFTLRRNDAIDKFTLVSIRRMPRPPPPHEALSMTG